MSDTASHKQPGLTLRSFVVCLVALFAMAVWIEYEELYNTYGGPLAENSPPNAAVGVICAVLVIGGILYKLRRPLRLVAAELVVIYAALVLAAPLMTQGMWHRIFGLIAGITHHQDFKSYESLPPMLWPHGENLVANGRFASEADQPVHIGGGKLTWGTAQWKGREWRAPVLSNDGDAAAHAALAFAIPRYAASGKEVLVPGENFLFSMLVKASGMVAGSAYSVRMQADDGPITTLLLNTEESRPSFSLPGGLARVGVSPVAIPEDLKSRLTLYVGLTGQGTLSIQDVQFLNVEAIEGVYSGRKVAHQRNAGALGPNERNFTVVRPDRMFSLAGLGYLVHGYIPLRQWLQPAIAWGLLIGGLFLGFLGLNILMRKQWVDHERFTFPLTILPKTLFAEREDGRLAIVRNRVVWIGFACTLPLVIWKGLRFYYPALPWFLTQDVPFAHYVDSPLLKAYLTNVGIGIGTGLGLSFCVLAIALLIETDILFALWTSFLLFQLWFLFGKAANFTQVPGYPWEFQQAMGGFIAYAGLAIFVGRQHLLNVFRAVIGRRKIPEEAAEVASYRTALLMIAGSIAIIVAWSLWTEMGVLAGVLFFGYMLVCGFAASKVRAEMGAPWPYLTPYFGMQFVAAMGGFAVFKSTGMLVATIASGFMCTACFLLIAPVQVEMMELGRHFRVQPRHVGAGLGLGLFGGLFIGGFVVLCWVYGLGANNLKTGWPYEQNWYYSGFRTGELNTDRALESGTLGKAPETQALNFIRNPDAKGLGIGVAVTVILAVLRARFTWFPFHPIGYVLASSFFMRSCWFYFFLAWLARLMLFRIGGAQTIRRGLIPFCVGMFLACIASIVCFDVLGIILRLRGVTEVYCSIP